MTATRLPDEFASREAMAEWLREAFPDAAARDGGALAPMRGGPVPAIVRIEAMRPGDYAKTRNFTDGAVTRLSPYIRHGVIGLAEARDEVLARSGRKAGYKLVRELAWRDYFLRVHAEIGDGVWQDREDYKTGWTAADYDDRLPAEIAQGRTGLACIDAFAAELLSTGWLHNHVRMYLAAYVVHFRRVTWQAGARWFLTHLIDGDEAANNLSWQWIASTFSSKPWIFDRGNLETHTRGAHCGDCSRRDDCPFDKPMDVLEAELFPNLRSRGRKR
jgi:deoxyribodipyrimidine photo-lyase